MEISTEVSTAPIVTKSESSFAESSQETKVEKIANGSVETAASSEKTVTQSVQSSLTNSGIEEIKQQSSSSSFSSSSVTVDENPSSDGNAIEASSEEVKTVIEKSEEETKATNGESSPQSEQIVAQSEQIEAENTPELIESASESKEEQKVEEEVVAAPNEEIESKVEQAENSESEITPNNSHSPNDSNVVNSNEPVETEVQSNECDEKLLPEQTHDTEAADQGSLPTVPEVEPILEAIEPSPPAQEQQQQQKPQPTESEVKVEAESTPVVAPPPVFEPLPTFTPAAPFEEQQQPQPEIVTQQQQYSNKEIEQESIKKQLNEIITDIEKNVQITNDDATENSNDAREGSEGKKPIDFQKIFTPANDVDEIKPGANRKLFASSSFYAPGLHPTVEDQVELARRISHSLSDISNQQSKGQSMYVNRKKRSVKWIHDDDGQEEQYFEENRSTKENGFETSSQHIEHSTNAVPVEEPKKVPLKLVMDPRHVQDFNSMRQFGYECPPMSPEFGIELCNALNAPHGKGAELFAKRRKKAEKWVVDGSKQQQQGTTPTAGSQFVPAFSDVGIQRVQHNMKLDQIQEKYINQHPSVKMVRSPWEAALETGNVDNAFVTYGQQSNQQQQMYQSSIIDYGSTASPSSSLLSSSIKKDIQYQSSKQFSGRDLAYKPNVPQGWNREIKLQTGMFVAPEIPVAISTTSSVTSSEKFSKVSTTTSTSFQDVFSSETSNFKQEQSVSAPAPFKPQQQQQFAPIQQQTAKPFGQSAGQSFPPPKPTTPVSFNKPQTPVSFNKPQTPVNVAPAPISKPYQAPVVVTSPAQTPISKPLTPISMSSPRSGLNASPVTPGILKKQIQLDAAVPIPPGGVVGASQSPVPSFNGSRLSAKSPVPFVNTAPAPFNSQFPPLSVQTPETIAQIAPAETPLVPPLRNPNEIAMPLIVSTPLPKYSTCYNNAARPFNEFKDYYKPIHMEEGKKLLPPLIYTDF